MLAKAACQAVSMLDVPASSRASPLPQWIFIAHRVCVRPRSKCGSGLARESGVSGGINVGCTGPFAGKPAPTVDLHGTQNLCPSAIKVWERACSRKRRVRRYQCWMCRPLRGQARSHSGSSSHTEFVSVRDQSVGASLLAKAADQSTWLLDVPTSSRASPLPQWIFMAHRICVRPRSKCGSGLARESGGSVDMAVGCADLFAGKPAPTRVAEVVLFTSNTTPTVGR